MGSVVHITEAEAVRDFAAVIDRALAGDEVILSRSGRDVVVLSAVAPTTHAMRPLGDVLDALERRKAAHGLAKVDDEFAADMGKVHEELNQPLDTSAWE